MAGKYKGRIGEEQLAFVANLLKRTPKERLVVAVMHIPLRTYDDRREGSNDTADAATFLKLLAGRPSVSFAGHTHTTEHHYLTPGAPGPNQRAIPGDAGPDRVSEGDGSGQGHHHHVLTAVSGSWWSGPFDRYGIPAADSRDGSPNGYHVLSMAAQHRPDPFVAAVFARNEATKKHWVEATPSSHVWAARLPADLEAGTHRIDVEAVDEYGRRHHDHMVVEVRGDGT